MAEMSEDSWSALTPPTTANHLYTESPNEPPDGIPCSTETTDDNTQSSPKAPKVSIITCVNLQSDTCNRVDTDNTSSISTYAQALATARNTRRTRVITVAPRQPTNPNRRRRLTRRKNKNSYNQKGGYDAQDIYLENTKRKGRNAFKRNMRHDRRKKNISWKRRG